MGFILGGRYRLDALLGAGGMAEVFAAHDVLLDRRVAVKLPSASTETARERFRREARAAAALNHPNVVAVFDWGEQPDPYLVMELVEGRSLRDVLTARRVLPPEEVADIGAQVADALEHAHAHGVVHRDVKPSNLLVTHDGVVKVSDFGISKSVSGDALTEPGGVIGTPGYLAPEQAAGLPADARTDVYALGVVLAELLTGERESTVDAGASATELERVVMRARAPEPAARYQRAGDLRDALRAVRQSLDAPVTAVPVATQTVAAGPTRTPIAAAVLPALVAAPALAATTAAPAPPQAAVTTGTPTTRKGWRRARAPRPVKPLKPPRVARKPRRATAPRPPKQRRLRRRNRERYPKLPKEPRPPRPWRARHVIAVLSAPLVLAGGALAYYEVTKPASVAVPSVVHRDVFGAVYVLQRAGFTVHTKVLDDPRPAGFVLAQHPRGGTEDEGSIVTITLSDTTTTVPDVVGRSEVDATAVLHKAGFATVQAEDDFRSDVDPGTVVGTAPVAFAEAAKADPVTVTVARDPHVTVPNVVAVDQATATAQLQQAGLEVSVRSASSASVPAGAVVSQSPSAQRVAVRGDTVTLTVSTGPKLVKVPYVVGSSSDDAAGELEDAGFTVSFATTPVGNGQVGDVVAQSPPGGQAPEGSDVQLTIGVRKR
ncbi:MAG TPA: PASTA domain-containing protein [Acidimicrobiia bacterium]